MAKLIVLSAVALLWIGFITGLPAPDEERYLDKEVRLTFSTFVIYFGPQHSQNNFSIHESLSVG